MQKKNGQNLEQHLIKDYTQRANECENILTIVIIRAMQIKATMWYHHSLIGISETFKK